MLPLGVVDAPNCNLVSITYLHSNSVRPWYHSTTQARSSVSYDNAGLMRSVCNLIRCFLFCFLSHLLGIIPELLLVIGSTLGSVTRPYPFPVTGNSYDRVFLSWSHMVEVHEGQNNGPIRR